jgi:hypothetical protein
LLAPSQHQARSIWVDQRDPVEQRHTEKLSLWKHKYKNKIKNVMNCKKQTHPVESALPLVESALPLGGEELQFGGSGLP